MSKVIVNVTDRKYKEHILEGEIGQTLMELIDQNVSLIHPPPRTWSFKKKTHACPGAVMLISSSNVKKAPLSLIFKTPEVSFWVDLIFAEHLINPDIDISRNLLYKTSVK